MKTKPENCAAQIMDSIPVVMHFIRRSVRLGKGGISLPQVRAMAYLFRSSNSSLNELSEYLGVSNASASNLVDRLVKKDFISRKEDPRERRCVLLNLTEKGRIQYQEIRLLAEKELSSSLNSLSDDDLKQIHEGLSLLRNTLNSPKLQDGN